MEIKENRFLVIYECPPTVCLTSLILFSYIYLQSSNPLLRLILPFWTVIIGAFWTFVCHRCQETMTACQLLRHICPSTTDYLPHGRRFWWVLVNFWAMHHRLLNSWQEDSKVGTFLSCQLWNIFVMWWVTNKQTTMSLEKLWNEENPRLQPANSASLLPS